jgi:very-short-patch-repair endonuclease
MLRALSESGLPRPRCNAILEIEGESFEIDMLWQEEQLAIETDGEGTHGTPLAFQRDRRRDQILGAAGYRTARVTWRQMGDEPAAVLERIRRMLEPDDRPER